VFQVRPFRLALWGETCRMLARWQPRGHSHAVVVGAAVRKARPGRYCLAFGVHRRPHCLHFRMRTSPNLFLRRPFSVLR
jgi:hypothetical protein